MGARVPSSMNNTMRESNHPFHANRQSIYFIGNGSEWILNQLALHLHRRIRTTRVKSTKVFVAKSIVIPHAKTEIHCIDTSVATGYDITALMLRNHCKAFFFVFNFMDRRRKYMQLNYVYILLKKMSITV